MDWNYPPQILRTLRQLESPVVTHWRKKEMVRVTAMNVQKALLCLSVLAVMTLMLPQQSAAQSPTPTPPDAGVPEVTVTTGDATTTTDITGVQTFGVYSTTLALGSATVSATTKSTTSTSTLETASVPPGSETTTFAQTQPTSTSSLSCSLHGAKDPGPRPTG